jgi:hypothetical protein
MYLRETCLQAPLLGSNSLFEMSGAQDVEVSENACLMVWLRPWDNGIIMFRIFKIAGCFLY